MAQLWRDPAGVIKASMSATGVMMAAQFIGNGAGVTGLPGGVPDNLGSHAATTTLAMSGFAIGNAASVTAANAVTASSASAAGALGAGAPRLVLAGNVIVSSGPGAALGGGSRISSNVYTMGFTSATAYYGDGSNLTGVPAGIPSGLIILFDGANCPSGWTEVTSVWERASRGRPDGATSTSDASTGGSDTHTHATDIASFTSGAGTAHNHTYTTGGPSSSSSYASTSGSNYASNTHTHTGTTSVASAHTHAIDPPSTTSGNNSVSPPVAYRLFIFCRKN
jgi:hypothetical protein